MSKLTYLLIFTAFLYFTLNCQLSILNFSTNKFNDVKANILNHKSDCTLFEKTLVESLKEWRTEKRNGVWLTIPIEHSSYIPIAAKYGFIFHHALDTKAVMTLWLPKNQENTLPSYATRTVGVAALVIDSESNVLVIKEKYKQDLEYSLPGGGVKMGEDIKEAAIRETKEETGIDAEFMGIIAWWERHGTNMDNVSDLYFVCYLRPINKNIIIQQSEIIEARWIPYNDFKKIAKGANRDFLAAYESSKTYYIPHKLTNYFNSPKLPSFYAHPDTKVLQK